MYIQLNGQILYYERTGEGRPLLLLHGNGESHEIFDRLAADLCADHEVYAIDSRGQGGSATPKEFHYVDMAKDVICFTQALGLSKPVLCGFSDGAIAALMAASEQSGLFSALVVCGANLSPAGLHPAARRRIRALYKKGGDPLVKMMLEEPSITEDDLARIRIPALVCAGEHDMVKKKETERIAKHIPVSQLYIFAGEDHGSYITHSDKLAPVMRPFLQTLGSQRFS